MALDKISAILLEEFKLKEFQVVNTLKLIDEGNTIPFIARYRKEATGELSDETLRNLNDRLQYLRNLEEKREEIIRHIDEQGKLTDELLQSIQNAKTPTELADIYRPYQPKRRTRATIAKEKGLEPLAELLLMQNENINPKAEAEKFINENVENADDALSGAMDIIAEFISDNPDYRKKIRSITYMQGILSLKKAKDEDSVYSMYYDFSEAVNKIANHRVLAVNRGEKEGFLKCNIDITENLCEDYLVSQTVKTPITASGEYVALSAKDSYKRLISPSIETEIRNLLTERAEESAIKVFSKNLSGLLLCAPVRGKTVLGLDPGYRTGCKVAVVDETGKVLDTNVIYCTLPNHDKEKAKLILKSMVEKNRVDLVSIGNGTASGETEMVVAELIAEHCPNLKYLIVSEAGASVYSASKLASKEFPEYDVSLRSAVSIARRLQDPLAELVKIEPKAIGVGQYQHDMNQKKLGEALGGVVEDCVNSVGIDLNTASPSLLSYVAGINSSIAENITAYREENGKFKNRKELLKVPRLGEKAFLQCAGFMRINDGNNVFDNTFVHPESYEVAENLITKLGYELKDVEEGKIEDIQSRLAQHNIEELATELKTGVPTLRDICTSLLKKGRDPREELPAPDFKSRVLSISDLKPGMIMKGTVRNVIDFGAFVDIGVHQDGLVHISQICDKYIKHPLEVLKVGDRVNVKILEIDENKKRISLTMRELDNRK